MKVNKQIRTDFVLELSQQDMEALKAICRQWEAGDTSTTSVSVDGPTHEQKAKLASQIIREGAALRDYQQS